MRRNFADAAKWLENTPGSFGLYGIVGQRTSRENEILDMLVEGCRVSPGDIPEPVRILILCFAATMPDSMIEGHQQGTSEG